MRGYNCYEEIEVYRIADFVCFKAGRNRHSGRGSLSQDRHFGSDFFQLEAEVFRAWKSGVAATVATRRREQSAKAGRRRFNARQTDAPRCFEKKL